MVCLATHHCSSCLLRRKTQSVYEKIVRWDANRMTEVEVRDHGILSKAEILLSREGSSLLQIHIHIYISFFLKSKITITVNYR